VVLLEIASAAIVRVETFQQVAAAPSVKSLVIAFPESSCSVSCVSAILLFTSGASHKIKRGSIKIAYIKDNELIFEIIII
jgi:hypothetical protein